MRVRRFDTPSLINRYGSKMFILLEHTTGAEQVPPTADQFL